MKNTFPWGIYIGELSPKTDTADSDDIPILLPAEAGGFSVVFDADSEALASHFIENVVLLLAEALPPKLLTIHLFDFDTAPRFRHLSQLKNHGLYHLYGNNKAAQAGFDAIEDIARQRLHELLPPTVENLSQYNDSANYPEPYHLLLLNLAYYPDDFIGVKRIKSFFKNAFQAGIYVIAYHDVADDHEGANNQRQISLQFLAEKFPALTVSDKQFTLSPQLFEFAELQEYYDYQPADCNKNSVLRTITNTLETQKEAGAAVDFLQVPIAKSRDGRSDVLFSLGADSQNYNAMIVGRVGSGKSVLLSNVIIGIAERYTAQQIQLVLMDFNRGVEFNVFKDHPNCAQVFGDYEALSMAVSVIEGFVHEMQTRGEAFAERHVKNIAQFNRAHPDTPMPHKLLIIDEAHRLFAGDYKQQRYFSGCLDTILREGRKTGLHIILSTQALSNSDIPSAVLDQTGLRIAFKLNEPKNAWNIFKHNNEAALHLDAKKREVLINADSGNQSANIIARANPPLSTGDDEVAAIRKHLQHIRASRTPEQCVTAEVVQAQEAPVAPETTEHKLFEGDTDNAPDWLKGGE